jgi:hypothetical protein
MTTKKPGEPAEVAGSDTDTPAKPVHVRQADRFRVVPLDWPIEFGGVTYDKITVNRMTTAQVAAFVAATENGSSDDGYAALPMFDAPRVVIDALDADDAERVNETVLDFLPRRYRDTALSSPTGGESTSASPPSASADKASTG